MGYRKPLIGFSLFAVLALLLTYTIWSTLERAVPGQTNGYTAYFSDASGLHPGDDVRMAGVRVGRVSDITLDRNRAKVTFDLQTDQTICVSLKLNSLWRITNTVFGTALPSYSVVL